MHNEFVRLVEETIKKQIEETTFQSAMRMAPSNLDKKYEELDQQLKDGKITSDEYIKAREQLENDPNKGGLKYQSGKAFRREVAKAGSKEIGASEFAKDDDDKLIAKITKPEEVDAFKQEKPELALKALGMLMIKARGPLMQKAIIAKIEEVKALLPTA